MKQFLRISIMIICVLFLGNHIIYSQNSHHAALDENKLSQSILGKSWYIAYGYKYDNRTNDLKPTGTQWTRYTFKENNVLEYCYKTRRTMEQTEPEIECIDEYYEVEGNNVVTICDNASKTYCKKFQILPKANTELFFRQIEKDVQWLELYFTSQDPDKVETK